jgi:hypothetical protein
MTLPMVTTAVSYSLNRVRVFFSDPMLGLGVSGNFTIAGLAVTAASASSTRFYTDLTTTGMTQGTSYIVVVGAGVTDDSHQALARASAPFKGALAPSDAEAEQSPTTATRLARHFAFADAGTPMFTPPECVKPSAADLIFQFSVELQKTQPVFVMRARHINDGLVWWVVQQAAPDFAAIHAPFPADQLTDIVLV